MASVVSVSVMIKLAEIHDSDIERKKKDKKRTKKLSPKELDFQQPLDFIILKGECTPLQIRFKTVRKMLKRQVAFSLCNSRRYNIV